ncbi:PIN domain-like protein [Lentithecium fluviatile CBS 122367]|uniref:PIN domain-like protein n=1 Tax=Lentithecium fluviatile CBS 122367 TaxID=1168545 RepID=A0A6G1J4T1_9PLEO|nr:PIN domain-like protein [Lentithecium fluviatile CBS 122367]
MGITGLLPLLKSIQQPCSLKKFAGQTIGVDAYGWLHRGTAACAIELAQDKPTIKFVDFAMNRVRMLVHFGITPYLVFDGDYLPSKAGTENERAGRRKEGKRLGLELLKVGKASQAHLELQKAVDVTPEMARMLIEELKYHNIQYVVAPFEADSQLAYLERKGIINGILSEDSDLLVFGAKCLITKLDKYGECVEINRNRFTACREINLVGWTDADFRQMAILSGCDYLPSIGSMGLKTAYRMLRKYKNVERLVKAAQFDGKFKVPAGYLDAFNQAEKTFLHQWVYCPDLNRVVNLTPPASEADIANMPFIGEEVPPHIAFGVARGELHPHTKQPLVARTENNRSGKPLKPPRAVSTTHTPIGKHSKPIDSFFKPKRTPLMELDVNLFTPSPSQQALLEQQRNSSGWEAIPAPQTGIQQILPAARTAPQPARRAISDSAATRRSAPNPSKRQRLCSDSVVDAPSAKNDQGTRSRFFASTAEPSPSLRTTKHRRKKLSQDLHMFSDDSVEDAMAALADLDEVVSQPKKKIKIFKDYAFSFESTSQSSASSKSTTQTSQESQESGTFTPATSHGSPELEPVTGVTKQLQGIRSKFSYISNTSSASTVKTCSKVSLTHTAVSTKRSSPVGPSESVTRDLRPTSGAAEVHDPRQHEDDDLLDESAWKAAEDEIIVAASSDVEATPPRKSATTSRREIKGSEELLVPDSDAESVCSPRKPLISLGDLGRFAFNA